MTDAASHVPGARRAWAALVALSLGAAGALPAQQPPPVHLDVRLTFTIRVGSRAPIVQSRDLLGDDRWVSALRSGLPVRLHYRLEVWRSREGWFDNFERQTSGTSSSGMSPCWTSTACSRLSLGEGRSGVTPPSTHSAPRWAFHSR